MTFRSTLATLVALSVATVCHADWPQFRGPTGQGLSTAKGLPIAWSPTQNIAWKLAVPGQGWSSPVLADGRIYLTSAVDVVASLMGDVSLRAVCVDAANGKILWSEEVFWQEGASAPKIHSKNSHASPTPIVSGGRVYVHFGHQGTACLTTDGKIVWRIKAVEYQPVHGNGGSPALVNGTLIFSCDGAENPVVVALSADTGEVVWKTPRPAKEGKKFAFSTPLPIEVGGRTQVVVPGAGAIVSYDPATGDELWQVRHDGYSTVPRPVYSHGLVLFTTGYDAPHFLAVRANGSGDVTDTHVAWRLTRSAPLNPSPLAVGEELYLISDGGVATCCDVTTGKVHWQKRIGGTFSSSPVHIDGKIYLLSEFGVCTVIAASKEHQELASNDMRERTLSSLAVGDDAIYLRTELHLYKIAGGR